LHFAYIFAILHTWREDSRPLGVHDLVFISSCAFF
jgi:hypothetical protein